jgi:hypothetical protein
MERTNYQSCLYQGMTFTASGKTHSNSSFVTGHDFSRAENGLQLMRALAPEEIAYAILKNFPVAGPSAAHA